MTVKETGVSRETGCDKCKLFRGRVTISVYILGVQKRFAKKFANFLHLSWDLSQGL